MNLFASLLLIALGGAAGSVTRALVALALPSRFPWATLLVNIAGSLLIGWLMVRFGPAEQPAAAPLRSLWAVGFCGGFTTFSAFGSESIALVRSGLPVALLNVAANVLLGLTAVVVGRAIAAG